MQRRAPAKDRRGLSGAVWLGAAVALTACVPQIGFDGTHYNCPDGVSCPEGFACVDLVCRDDVGGAPTPDAASQADAAPPPPAPDAAVPGAPPGPMAMVPASTNDEGCLLLIDDGCQRDATPKHDLDLSAYQIDLHEVTQAEYQACVLAGACASPRASFDPAGHATFPVTDVSWDDALAYCTFAGKRPPTEAEWEHAARGPDELEYPWGKTDPDCLRANFAGCGGIPVAVGSHTEDASAFGATEMAGNVAEWVADFYAADYYDDTPRANPPGPATGTERSLRGGSCLTPLTALPSWVRAHAPPGQTAPDLGFRCAK